MKFNKCQNSHNTQSIIYEDLESLIKMDGKLMNVKIILKKRPQQKQMNIFPANNQCIKYGHLIVLEKSMIYSEMKIAWRGFENPSDNT